SQDSGLAVRRTDPDPSRFERGRARRPILQLEKSGCAKARALNRSNRRGNPCFFLELPRNSAFSDSPYSIEFDPLEERFYGLDGGVAGTCEDKNHRNRRPRK